MVKQNKRNRNNLSKNESPSENVISAKQSNISTKITLNKAPLLDTKQITKTIKKQIGENPEKPGNKQQKVIHSLRLRNKQIKADLENSQKQQQLESIIQISTENSQNSMTSQTTCDTSETSQNIYSSSENSNSNQNKQQIYYDALTGSIDTKDLTHQKFLELVRQQAQKVAKGQKSLQSSQDVFVKQYILEKSCEVCESFLDDEHMLLCDYCDDAYHTYCLEPVLIEVPGEDDDWYCKDCELKKQQLDIKKKEEQEIEIQKYKKYNKNTRQSCLEEHQFEKIQKIQICNCCENQIQNEQAENCIRCKNKFHKQCFNTKKNSICCKDCQEQIKNEMPTNQTQITNYFCVKAKQMQQQQQNNSNKYKNLKQNQQNNQIQQKGSMRLSEPIVKNKNIKKIKQTRFKLQQPSKDPKIQLQIKKAFIYALKAKNIQFDDDLQFSKECPPKCNDTSLEPNLQKISEQNLEVFTSFKEMTRKGEYAPVIIEEDKLQGFVVRALEDIPDLTLLCEYVGQVDKMKNRVMDDNDSIMELLKTARSQTTLVIVPQNFGNLARFLSGINNDSKESRKKQNVQSIRMNVNGHARVFLYAKKKIHKGDLLYYDYNAGGFGDYPTENFV